MTETVGIVQTDRPLYPSQSPYHPAEAYPEYPFGEILQSGSNDAYKGVRELLRVLNLDAARYNTPEWNPLGAIVKPGMSVVIKPNFVRSRHAGGGDLYSLITHPAVIRAVADYCWIALKGDGRIVIADAPQYDCNWQELMSVTELEKVTACYFKGGERKCEILDLRKYWSAWKHFPSLLRNLPGDPKGSVTVDLGRAGAFYGRPNAEKLYGAVYHRQETIAAHRGETQQYELAQTIMESDVVISMPKLKVHKKVGTTLNIKGIVGACTNKNLLVHYTLGPPSRGGDQYPDSLLTFMEESLIRTERWMYDHFLATRKRSLEFLHRSIYWLHNHSTKLLGIKVDEKKRLLDAGNWYGNDSAWRMAVDLFNAFCFADARGTLHPTPQRHVFSVVDGITGGENNGPLIPDPVRAGVLIGGSNLLAVDLVATRLMGFDPMRLKMYRSLLQMSNWDHGIRHIDDIRISSMRKDWTCCLQNKTNQYLGFRPHPGWVGHVETQAT